MDFFDFFNLIDKFNWEDIVLVGLLYNFFKFLVMSAFIELIWPTQSFNRKHNIGYQTFKFRTFVETVLKLRSKNVFLSSLNIYFFKYFIF